MPKQVNHAERRTEIDTIVWEIVAEDGIAAVTLRSIAARGNISMGRVQHYFPTRDAIVQHALTSFLAVAERAHPIPDDPRDGLLTLLIHAIPRDEPQQLGSKVWYAYLAESITDPDLKAIVSEALRGTEDLATTLLDGDRNRARILLSAADGIIYRALIGIVTPQNAEAAIRDLISTTAPRTP
ncbi:TetR/AcrR family transcriptional regulator [Rhodococcus qingshengii]|uniref:TetR/AcrR family transcriptional regulator n=1 Tax=Rhodococcus TaxID=1827 RepID=UPI001BAFB62A|nr:TetR/AcrR family transcriptional regulator [Rhodococcus qingshengii]MBS3695705.1 TetR/AcrR family transcriptional regulator [Rhodococcus qingshengii]